ncbi:MAG: MarR family transcriptional regulator [Pseudomonadota bacterium]
MTDSITIDQARFVFTTGKMIHDRVFQIQVRQLAGMKKKERFGDLSMAQVNALMIIRTRGPLSLTQLAGQLGVSPPSASAMVERLVEKALVSREQSPEDRRRVVIGISPAALKEIMTIEDVVFQSFVDLVARIGPEAAAQWCAVLEKVRTVLSDAPPPHHGMS